MQNPCLIGGPVENGREMALHGRRLGAILILRGKFAVFGRKHKESVDCNHYLTYRILRTRNI